MSSTTIVKELIYDEEKLVSIVKEILEERTNPVEQPNNLRPAIPSLQDLCAETIESNLVLDYSIFFRNGANDEKFKRMTEEQKKKICGTSPEINQLKVEAAAELFLPPKLFRNVVKVVIRNYLEKYEADFEEQDYISVYKCRLYVLFRYRPCCYNNQYQLFNMPYWRENKAELNRYFDGECYKHIFE
jgi:hypothetical protein